MDRRKALHWIVQTTGLVVTAVIALPAALVALTPVLRGRRPDWQPLGPVEQFPQGEVTEAHVEVPRDDWSEALREKGVYVWRPAADELVVFSRNCTDLSCPVTFDRGSQWFFCPCHGGIFAKNGDRMAGPPKRPLYRYANRVRDGVLEIDVNSLPAVA